MNKGKHEKVIYKKQMIQKLYDKESSSLNRYKEFYVGSSDLGELLKFELLTSLLGLIPGALGLLLRKYFYPYLFKKVGRNVLWGKNITLRYPGNIEIGDQVAIDDNCLLDAKGVIDQGIRIGNDVIIARDTIIQGKTAGVKIGDRCVIGSQCQLSSAGGIFIGNYVMLSGKCYIGGGHYRTEDIETPMIDQDLYSKGPVVIEDDVWLGAGVVILDGVRIGKGCFVGAGSIIRDDIKPYTIVAPQQKLVKIPREIKGETIVKEKNNGGISAKQNERSDKIPTDRMVQDSKEYDHEKTSTYDRVVMILFSVLDEINHQLPAELRLVKTLDTIIYISSDERNLDSLGIVNLIVMTEQKIEEKFGFMISLTDENFITENHNPLQTIKTFASYIYQSIKQKTE
jgi:acetyltransferase-like isoleucine patch superfamily enzyme/acyl carrier protein